MKNLQNNQTSSVSGIIEPHFRAALDNLSEGIAICSPVYDSEGRIIDFIYEYGNDALALIIKVDKDFLLKRKISDVLSGFSETELFRQCCEVISTGNPAKRSCIEIDQTILDHKLHGYFDLSITGCQGNVLISMHSLTERVEAEKKINQITRQLEDIINGAPNPIFVKDLDGNFIKINKKLEELLGITSEELKGKTDFDIVSRESAEFFREHDRKITESGTLIQIEEEADLADGLHHIFMTNKFPLFDQNGEVYATCGISTDITGIKAMERELRKSEERFRVVQEVSPDGFTIFKPYFDQDGNLADFIFVYENPAVAKMNGTVPDEVTGRRLLEIFPGHENTQFFRTYKEVYESGRVIEFEDHYKGETIVKDKWFRIVTVPISDGIAILAQDITERKLSERKIIEALAELERSNKELEQFAYVASHDLQEPLRMISSYITMLDRKYSDLLDNSAKQYIHFAVDGAKRMADLIHDLLSYSRLKTRKEAFRKTDLNLILDDVSRDLQVAVRETGTELKIGNMPELNVDQSQIKQLFQNLIQNAIKFRNKEKQTCIDVTAEHKDGVWVFSVSDNGIGISHEYHEKIFMLFQQLHAKDQYTGTGLGLAICKKIVERHGGKIWIESEKDKGSTFYFTLRS